MIFLHIGIISYTTIPSVADYIVFAGSSLSRGVTNVLLGGVQTMSHTVTNAYVRASDYLREK